LRLDPSWHISVTLSLLNSYCPTACSKHCNYGPPLTLNKLNSALTYNIFFTKWQQMKKLCLYVHTHTKQSKNLANKAFGLRLYCVSQVKVQVSKVMHESHALCGSLKTRSFPWLTPGPHLDRVILCVMWVRKNWVSNNYWLVLYH